MLSHGFLTHRQPFARQQQQQQKTFDASDYYLDYTKSVYEVVIVFLTQCSLLGFYLLGLYTDGTPKFSNGRVFAFYYAGPSSAHTLHIHCTYDLHSFAHVCVHVHVQAHVTCYTHAHV